MPKPDIPPSVREALESVLAYNWPYELEDLLEQEDEVPYETHVFSKLVEIDNWLNDNNKTVEDYFKEIQ